MLPQALDFHAGFKFAGKRIWPSLAEVRPPGSVSSGPELGLWHAELLSSSFSLNIRAVSGEGVIVVSQGAALLDACSGEG